MSQTQTGTTVPAFLRGGGEMGAIIAAYNWASTPLGPIGSWPGSLQTSLSLILTARFPMLIFWGPALITFYNDAFRPSLGTDGKHPGSLGQRAEESWAESWPVIGPMIHDIMSGGESVWFEDQKLPIYRDGKMDHAYWTYSFSAVNGPDGTPEGLLVACAETTKAVESLEALQTTNSSLEETLAENLALQERQREQADVVEQSQERLLALFEQSPVALATIVRENLTFTSANPFYAELVGRRQDQIVGKPLLEALPEIAGQGFDRLLNNVLDSGVAFITDEIPVLLKRKGRMETIFVNLAYQPMRDEENDIAGILVVATDVTPQVISRKLVEQSGARFQHLVRNAAVGMILLVGEELRVEMVNEAYAAIIGHPTGALIHRPIFDVIPDAAADFRPLLERVLQTGEELRIQNAPYRIRDAQGAIKEGFHSLIYQSYSYDSDESPGVMVVVQDVSAEVEARRKLEEIELFQQLLIDSVPAMIFYLDREGRYRSHNKITLEWYGVRPEHLVGKTTREFIGELAYSRIAPHMERAFAGEQVQFEMPAPARLSADRWLSIVYTPHRDAAGAVQGLIVHATDITRRKLSELALQASESRLGAAVELAELGTWQIDLRSAVISYSERLQAWLGVSGGSMTEGLLPRIHPEDQQRVREAFEGATAHGGIGRFDAVYKVIHAGNGQMRVLHASGRTQFDEQGEAVFIAGTARDITIQRELQLTLEQEVKLRTEELAALNEELQVTNEELADSNAQLLRSNDELGQFAYVASHDLQEPLRKIQVFSGMLDSEAGLSEPGRNLLGKIVHSSRRMSFLIRDLLEFSRLLKPEEQFRPVNLNDTIAALSADFELIRSEKGAEFRIDVLPTIEAIPLQMNQLFYNLISNALKFTRPGVRPLIRITAQEEPAGRTPAPHFRICVIDNGIGFDQAYAEQIFEIFKRLHARNEYAGSGIGLALCRRIVDNHNGQFYAESAPGAGATFCLVLPQRQ